LSADQKVVHLGRAVPRVVQSVQPDEERCSRSGIVIVPSSASIRAGVIGAFASSRGDPNHVVGSSLSDGSAKASFSQT
jgi:N-acetylneuraminic acid mutarotase